MGVGSSMLLKSCRWIGDRKEAELLEDQSLWVFGRCLVVVPLYTDSLYKIRRCWNTLASRRHLGLDSRVAPENGSLCRCLEIKSEQKDWPTRRLGSRRIRWTTVDRRIRARTEAVHLKWRRPIQDAYFFFFFSLFPSLLFAYNKEITMKLIWLW